MMWLVWFAYKHAHVYAFTVNSKEWSLFWRRIRFEKWREREEGLVWSW